MVGKARENHTKFISRFTRNTVDRLNYIRVLKEIGIAVIFEKENINIWETDSKILITMLEAFAQAKVVRKIYEMLLTGASLQKITDYLESGGVQNSSGKDT